MLLKYVIPLAGLTLRFAFAPASRALFNIIKIGLNIPRPPTFRTHKWSCGQNDS